MTETTVEITGGDEEHEDVAESTAIQAVAETAKSEAVAQQAASEVQSTKWQTEENADEAEQSAHVSAQAALAAGEASLRAQEAAAQAQQNTDKLNEVTSGIASLNSIMQELVGHLKPQQDTAPDDAGGQLVITADESPQKKPFLMRKWGTRS